MGKVTVLPKKSVGREEVRWVFFSVFAQGIEQHHAAGLFGVKITLHVTAGVMNQEGICKDICT